MVSWTTGKAFDLLTPQRVEGGLEPSRAQLMAFRKSLRRRGSSYLAQPVSFKETYFYIHMNRYMRLF